MGCLHRIGGTQSVVSTNGGMDVWRTGFREDGYGDKVNIPNHSLISWLTMHKRLLTKEILLRLGISQDSNCLICGGNTESVIRLFFEYQFSRACLQEILNLMRIGIQ